jgi:hypothetical protein
MTDLPTQDSSAHSDGTDMQELPKRPSQRAFVSVPACVFFIFDLFLVASARPFPAAVVLAALTTAVVAWFLNRRYKDTVRQWERAVDELRRVNDPHLPARDNGLGTPRSTKPPVGSWANPSRGQKLRTRFDRNAQFGNRRRRF